MTEKTGDGVGVAAQPPVSSRHPERNRKLLIDATLDSIAGHGIAETTVSRITEKAGLSRGMIHLHFGSKESLLAAAAEAYSGEYYAELDRGVGGKCEDPVALIRAIIEADLGEGSLNTRSCRILHAFRGEAATNPGIARFSSTRDQRLRTMLHESFSRLAGSSADPALASDATLGTLALLEGMWADFLAHEDNFDRAIASRIVFRFLSALFPKHFA